MIADTFPTGLRVLQVIGALEIVERRRMSLVVLILTPRRYWP